MKPSPTGRVISGLLMTGAAALPVLTTAELIAHVSRGGAGSLAAPQAASQSTAGGASSAPSSQRSQSAGGVRTVTGPAVQDPFGTVQATVTLNGNRITNVAISAPMDNGASSAINSQAIPLLRQETLQAQSAQINLVSGATLTSQAYAQSLQAALSQAGAGGGSSSATSGAVAAGAGGPSLSVHTRGDGEERD